MSVTTGVVVDSGATGVVDSDATEEVDAGTSGVEEIALACDEDASEEASAVSCEDGVVVAEAGTAVVITVKIPSTVVV